MPELREMDTGTDSIPPAAALRAALAGRLREQGVIRSDRVLAAFRAVPRHVFAPGVPVEAAYADDAVVTKRDEHGIAASSVSAPQIQAMMLEQAQLAAGMRALEIGSGGYNAALMAELAGESGEVTTADIDPEVTGRACRCLAAAGYGRVNVVLADAELGVPQHAPYDRIIVTAGAWDIPPAWADELKPGGRIVVPLRLRGLTRSVVFERDGRRLVSRGHQMCGFVPIQGAGAHQERLIRLHGEDVALRFDDDQPVDAAGLREALLRPRAQAWAGVVFGEVEPFDGLYLWLATCLDGFALLTRGRTDAARALADPSSSAGTPALVDGGSFAYHTFRRTGTGTYEFGAYAHGPDAARLAGQMTAQIQAWDREHRHGAAPQIAVYPAATPDAQLPPGRVIGKRHTRITISWPGTPRQGQAPR